MTPQDVTPGASPQLGPQQISAASADQKRKLDSHFVGGVAWTAGAKWATQLLSWGYLFIVARLLSTSDFGISEMASYFFLLTNVLAEFGVGTAVLQMQELEKRTLVQLHTFSCMLGSIAFVSSSLAAPLIALFFHNEHLTNLIRFNNLAFLLIGFQAVPLGLLQRDMDYRRLSIAEATQMVILSSLTVLAAWTGFGYWSFVIGAFIGKLTGLVLVSYWKPMPFAMPRWREIRRPIELGRQAAIGRLAWAFYTQSDGIIIGRVLGDSSLGVYRMAMNLASAPAEKVSTLIMRATGPLFAKVQNDPALVRRYLLILTEVLTMIELPLMVGLGMVAPEAVRVILEPKWAGLVSPLRWLVVFMTMRTLGTLIEQVLISQRATRFTMRLSLLNLLMMPVAFFFMAHWKGSSGVAASWVVLAPVTVFPLVLKVIQTVHARSLDFLNALLPAVSSCAVMVAVLFGLRMWLVNQSLPALASLITQVVAGTIVYGAVLIGFFGGRVQRYVRFLRDMRKGKKEFTGTGLGEAALD